MNGPLPARQYATAMSPAAFTARTSMPSTCSPGMLKEMPRLEKSVCADERVTDVPMVGGAVAEIGQADEIVAAVAVGESQARSQRHLRADDAVAAIKILLLA